MSEILTKAMARNIFYGGSLFFIAVFGLLIWHSHRYIVTTSTDRAAADRRASRSASASGSATACINCHTILGEGAYFAPELGNVMTRWGVHDDPEAAFETLKGWMEAHAVGRRGPPADAAVQPDRRGDPRRSPTSCSGPTTSTPRAGRRTTPAEENDR